LSEYKLTWLLKIVGSHLTQYLRKYIRYTTQYSKILITTRR